MEQNRNFKGIERYESLLKTICDQKNDYQFEEEIFTEEKEWKECLEEKEWEGCLGIACVLSVIEGINPSLPSLSKHLGIFNNKNLQNLFKFLFSKTYDFFTIFISLITFNCIFLLVYNF